MSVLFGAELMSVLPGTELMSVLSGTELMSVLSGAELMSWCGCICTHDAKSGVDRAMQTNREALKTMSRQVIPTSSRNSVRVGKRNVSTPIKWTTMRSGQ